MGISWKTIGVNNKERYISLQSLSKIITHDDFEFINLQYGDTQDERNEFEKEFGKKIIEIKDLDLNNDFDSLAALIQNCDLILTISNFTAHLAGSIGKKTWIMIPLDTQWHWFYKRNNSLWYPDIKIFRQSEYGDWKNVLKNVYNEIKNINSI